MNEEVIKTIRNKLTEIEKTHDVTILYAVESGSRAWGFESTDSDYDIRFIYAHPKNQYLNILPKKDVIECSINDVYDYSGWDQNKFIKGRGIGHRSDRSEIPANHKIMEVDNQLF